MKWGSEQKLGRKKDELGIGPLINLTSMADVVQIDAALSRVEFVNDAVVANSQLEFGSALKSLVREVSQSSAECKFFSAADTAAATTSCIARLRSRAATGLAWLLPHQ